MFNLCPLVFKKKRGAWNLAVVWYCLMPSVAPLIEFHRFSTARLLKQQCYRTSVTVAVFTVCSLKPRRTDFRMMRPTEPSDATLKDLSFQWPTLNLECSTADTLRYYDLEKYTRSHHLLWDIFSSNSSSISDFSYQIWKGRKISSYQFDDILRLARKRVKYVYELKNLLFALQSRSLAWACDQSLNLAAVLVLYNPVTITFHYDVGTKSVWDVKQKSQP